MPNVEIRPARAEEMVEFAHQASRQLALPAGMFAGMAAERTMCAFVDGALATTYAFWPLQIRLADAALPVRQEAELDDVLGAGRLAVQAHVALVLPVLHATLRTIGALAIDQT